MADDSGTDLGSYTILFLVIKAIEALRQKNVCREYLIGNSSRVD